MKLSWDEIQANAITFSKRWKDARNEEAEAQSFVTDFLRVFGVDDPVQLGDFEYKAPLSGGRTGYIDYVWKGSIAIEMKSSIITSHSLTRRTIKRQRLKNTQRQYLLRHS